MHSSNAAATTPSADRLPRSLPSWCPPARLSAGERELIRLREAKRARTGGAK